MIWKLSPSKIGSQYLNPESNEEVCKNYKYLQLLMNHAIFPQHKLGVELYIFLLVPYFFPLKPLSTTVHSSCLLELWPTWPWRGWKEHNWDQQHSIPRGINLLLNHNTHICSNKPIGQLSCDIHCHRQRLIIGPHHIHGRLALDQPKFTSPHEGY